MVNDKKLFEQTLSLKDVYLEACQMINKNDGNQIANDTTLAQLLVDYKNGFEKRKQKLSKTLPLDLSRVFSNPDSNGYAFPELSALLFAAYLSEDQRNSGFASKIFQKEKLAKITLTEKQQFLSKVIDRLESRHKDQEDYPLINEDLDKIKASYEDYNRYEQDLKNRIEKIKSNLTQEIDERLQNVGASVGLNEYLFNSTIEKIKKKDFSVSDFFDIANSNDLDSIGLTEIFEKDVFGHMKLNHTETKMQLTRADRMMVIDKFEEFLTDAMDNWTVYLEEFERARHEEYHQKFDQQIDSSTEFDLLSFKLPRAIINNNLEPDLTDSLLALHRYSSIQETDSGLIANIQLKTSTLESTDSVNQKVMDEYQLMYYDFLINTQTAVSAKRYEDIINFDKDGLNYADYCENKEKQNKHTPPSHEEEQNYIKVTKTNNEVIYQPKPSPEEMRETYFFQKKYVEEEQMYLNFLSYQAHIGNQSAKDTLNQLYSENAAYIEYIENLFNETHFGEIYVFSKDIQSQCQSYIEGKLDLKKKLSKAIRNRDPSVDKLSEAYQSIPYPSVFFQAMALYCLNITLPEYKKQLTYILSKKTNIRNNKKQKKNTPNEIKLINWRDVYIYNKDNLIFIPYDLLLSDITIRKVNRTRLKRYRHQTGNLRPTSPKTSHSIFLLLLRHKK